MDYFFYNTDANAITEQPRPRFHVLIDQGFAAVGGDRKKYGEQFMQLSPGDVLLMYENGEGVVAVGTVQERWDGVSHEEPRYYKTPEMGGPFGVSIEYRIAVKWFLDFSHSPIGIEEIRKRFGYTPRGAIMRIMKQRETVTKFVEELGSKPVLLPEEINESHLHLEGASFQVAVNVYERNPVARRQCIQHYGSMCFICGFSFGLRYGAEAEGYIHVHHILPLSEIREEYMVDPVKDLRPVCPNCHAILHLGSNHRSIEDVQKLLRQQGHA